MEVDLIEEGAFFFFLSKLYKRLFVCFKYETASSLDGMKLT